MYVCMYACVRVSLLNASSMRRFSSGRTIPIRSTERHSADTKHQFHVIRTIQSRLPSPSPSPSLISMSEVAHTSFSSTRFQYLRKDALSLCLSAEFTMVMVMVIVMVIVMGDGDGDGDGDNGIPTLEDLPHGVERSMKWRASIR